MQVGDLVEWNKRTYVVARIYESKCWRTDQHGPKINWGSIDPEPFVEILVGGTPRGVPQADVELVCEV